MANGPTPARMLPQFCAVATIAPCRRRPAGTGSRRRSPGARRARDDRHLAGERIGAADAVDLTRVGRPHRREQHAVARRRVRRQVAGEKVRALGRAAAHHQAGNPGLHRGLLSYRFRLAGRIDVLVDRRRAMGVEALDRLQPPGLALLALGFRPHDRLPVGRQHQPRAGIGDLDAVAAGFVDVEEEGLLDRVLVRAGFDVHAVLEEDVGRTQHVLAAESSA